MSELTKQQALNALKRMRSEIDKENWLFVGTINPKMVDYAIEALENAPTVEANVIIDGLNNEIDDLSENLAWYINERNRLISEKKRPKGEWIETQRGIHVTDYKCSCCGRTVRDDTGYDVSADYPFCHCGADMRGDTE